MANEMIGLEGLDLKMIFCYELFGQSRMSEIAENFALHRSRVQYMCYKDTFFYLRCGVLHYFQSPIFVQKVNVDEMSHEMSQAIMAHEMSHEMYQKLLLFGQKMGSQHSVRLAQVFFTTQWETL